MNIPKLNLTKLSETPKEKGTNTPNLPKLNLGSTVDKGTHTPNPFKLNLEGLKIAEPTKDKQICQYRHPLTNVSPHSRLLTQIYSMYHGISGERCDIVEYLEAMGDNLHILLDKKQDHSFLAEHTHLLFENSAFAVRMIHTDLNTKNICIKKCAARYLPSSQPPSPRVELLRYSCIGPTLPALKFVDVDNLLTCHYKPKRIDTPESKVICEDGNGKMLGYGAQASVRSCNPDVVRRIPDLDDNRATYSYNFCGTYNNRDLYVISIYILLLSHRSEIKYRDHKTYVDEMLQYSNKKIMASPDPRKMKVNLNEFILDFASEESYRFDQEIFKRISSQLR